MRTATAAIALAIGLAAAPALAHDATVLPGELVGPSIDTTRPEERHYFHDTCNNGEPEFFYAIVPISYHQPGYKPRPAYAVVPAETEEGKPLNAQQAATLFWRSQRHWGYYTTKANAMAAVRWINEPMAAESVAICQEQMHDKP